MRTMSAALTADLLERITPPPGEAGEAQAMEFDTTVQRAVGTCNMADARLVMLVRRALLEGWWRHRGCHSPEHWVAAQLGLDAARARRLVRIAMELGAYPATAERFAAGLLTEAHVFEIVTRVDPGSDGTVAISAGHWNIGQLRQWSANFPKPVEPAPVDPDEGPEPEPADRVEPEPFDLPTPDPTPTRQPTDRWWGQWNDEGRYVGGFDLDAELGGLVDKAMRAARSRVFTEATGIDLDDDDKVDLSAITTIDVLRRLLHAALAGLDPATVAGQRPGERYQVLVHLDAEHPERSRIHLGPLLRKADRQYLTCDAELRSLLWKDGSPVSVGRLRRTVDAKQRALVEDRDRCCVVCGSTGFLHIHHEIFWEDGGTTDLVWLFATCPTDHKAIHRGDIKVLRDPLDPSTRIFLDRHGRPLPRPAPLPPPGGPPPGEPYRGPARGRMPRWYNASGRRAA
jgi:hypothetical protein